MSTSCYALVCIAFLAILYELIGDFYHSELPQHIDCTNVDHQFESVLEAFRLNFLNGWETDGASLTVFYQGEKVVDCWGGYADRYAARKWQKDTIMMTFSCLEAVASLCVALLVDRGALSYNDLVAKHWPEFSKNGKSNITVQMTLSHTATFHDFVNLLQSGLIFFDKPLNETAARDHESMRVVLENEQPKWPPGTRKGHHSFMCYWIIDQLIRHIDKNHRGMAQFFDEEIAKKYDVDYSIGLSADNEYRLARIAAPTWMSIIGEIYDTPQLIRTLSFFMWNSKVSFSSQELVFNKMADTLRWLQLNNFLQINNPDYHDMLYNGFGNARSIAKLFNTMVDNGIISRKTQNLMNTIQINGTDMIFDEHFAKESDFYSHNLNRAKIAHVLSHSGFGCQQIVHDYENHLTITYLTNAIKIGIYDQCRTYRRLQSTIYDSIEGQLKQSH